VSAGWKSYARKGILLRRSHSAQRTMGIARSTAETGTYGKPNDAWLIGIILAVVNAWLFAQTLLGNLAVSITALFSGILIVIARGLADRLGPVRIMNLGLVSPVRRRLQRRSSACSSPWLCSQSSTCWAWVLGGKIG
jgi:hypothetical protein